MIRNEAGPQPASRQNDNGSVAWVLELQLQKMESGGAQDQGLALPEISGARGVVPAVPCLHGNCTDARSKHPLPKPPAALARIVGGVSAGQRDPLKHLDLAVVSQRQWPRLGHLFVRGPCGFGVQSSLRPSGSHSGSLCFCVRTRHSQGRHPRCICVHHLECA